MHDRWNLQVRQKSNRKRSPGSDIFERPQTFASGTLCCMEDAYAESGLIQCAAVHMQPTSTIYPAREEPCVLRAQARSVFRGSASSRISENQSQRSRSELGSRRSGDNRFGGHHRISERGLSGTLAAGAA